MTTTSERSLRWRPSTRLRKVLLLTHIAAAGTWLGLDVVLGLLVARVLLGGDDVAAAAALVSVGAFATWPLAGAGLLTLGTGLLLGTGTRYGLVRYWWVAVKLVLNLVLVTLVLLVLAPEVGDLAAEARAGLVDGTPPPATSDLAFPPLVSTTCVLVAMTLSVLKPWGRVRRRPDRAVAASDDARRTAGAGATRGRT